MTNPMKEVNIKKVKMNKHDAFIFILDSIMIEIDEEDSLDDDVMDTKNDAHASYFDDIYETIDIDHNLLIIIL